MAGSFAEGSFTGAGKQPVLAIKLHQDDWKPCFIQKKLVGWLYRPYCHAVPILRLAFDGNHRMRGAAVRHRLNLRSEFDSSSGLKNILSKRPRHDDNARAENGSVTAPKVAVVL